MRSIAGAVLLRRLRRRRSKYRTNTGTIIDNSDDLSIISD